MMRAETQLFVTTYIYMQHNNSAVQVSSHSTPDAGQYLRDLGESLEHRDVQLVEGQHLLDDGIDAVQVRAVLAVRLPELGVVPLRLLVARLEPLVVPMHLHLHMRLRSRSLAVTVTVVAAAAAARRPAVGW